MKDRNIWISGFVFFLVISVAVFGNIREAERKKELVKDMVIADFSKHGYRLFYNLAYSWKRCLRLKDKSGQGENFDYSVCNIEEESATERWKVEYFTQLGTAAASYIYSTLEDGARKFECIEVEGTGKLECREVF